MEPPRTVEERCRTLFGAWRVDNSGQTFDDFVTWCTAFWEATGQMTFPSIQDWDRHRTEQHICRILVSNHLSAQELALRLGRHVSDITSILRALSAYQRGGVWFLREK
jgi:hypothetical protein